jgi:hypothetical protein
MSPVSDTLLNCNVRVMECKSFVLIIRYDGKDSVYTQQDDRFTIKITSEMKYREGRRKKWIRKLIFQCGTS